MVSTEADQHSQLAKTSKPSPGCYINVWREGGTVHLSFKTANEYNAIEMYEGLVEAIKRGSLTLDLKLIGRRLSECTVGHAHI